MIGSIVAARIFLHVAQLDIIERSEFCSLRMV